MNHKHADYMIVGGGVCGSCVVEELNDLLESEEVPGTSDQTIIFISGSGGYIKRVVNVKQIGQLTTTFDVVDSEVFYKNKRLQCINDDVTSWDPSKKIVILRSGLVISYVKLAIATGASPKRTFGVFSSPFLIRLRDTQTINDLNAALSSARRVLIIGNGGIASELAFELRNIEVVWAIRHSSISATYFDKAAAKFFESKLVEGRVGDDVKTEVKLDRIAVVSANHDGNAVQGDDSKMNAAGSALGPHWLAKLAMDCGEETRKIAVLYEVELECVTEEKPPLLVDDLPNSFQSEQNWKLWACLNNKKCVGCDLIIEATGVVPNSIVWKMGHPELELAEDGGILVDDHMRTNVADVFAAGDVCTVKWSNDTPHWKQVRLWTQARQMGIYCARAMLIENLLLDISFDVFSHVTTFFGYKIVLLGDFLAEKLEKPFEINYRITGTEEYIKVITKNHRVHGAVLIGETELEEVMENLILDQIDISEIEENLLNPNVDIDDFFD